MDFILIRDVYHCPPSELEKQDASLVALHLQFLSVEAKQKKKEEMRSAQKQRKK